MGTIAVIPRKLQISPHNVIRAGLTNAALFVPVAFLLVGCAGAATEANSGPPPPQVAITTQPVNQVVPIGRSATFTVTATDCASNQLPFGCAPIQYQWSKNGASIPGETSSSYTTPNVTLSDAGSTYQVTVSNAVNSVTSSTVTLTAGPRAPALGDLRYLLYEQVTLPGFGAGGTGIITGVASESRMHLTFQDSLGSPFMLGSWADCIADGCEYGLNVYKVPSPMTGLSTDYQAGWYDGSYKDFDAGVRSSFGSDVVIFSLDFERAAGVFGLAWVTTSQPGGFDYRMEAVPPSQVQATAAADGAQSRIVTAAAFDDASGNAVLISYGWQGDTATVYDAQTVVATDADVASQAQSLAGQGYFISAFGGNDNDGYILVGMRVHGDVMPRPAGVGTRQPGFIPVTNPDNAYYTTVVYLEYYGNYALIQEQ